MELWLKEDEYFKFVKEIECKEVIFQLYLDDYGQSYHLAWRDPKTNEVKSWCCGTYNSYEWDIEDIADYINEQKGESNE